MSLYKSLILSEILGILALVLVQFNWNGQTAAAAAAAHSALPVIGVQHIGTQFQYC